MDTMLLIIATIYLACTFESTLISFLNSCELIYLSCFRKTHTINYNKQGFLLEAVGNIIFLIDTASKYSEYVEASGILTAILYLIIAGQFIVVICSFGYYYFDRKEFKWSYDWTKGILRFLYGANVGLFFWIFNRFSSSLLHHLLDVGKS
ncbi:unnamed protein product [Paramecium pentaurelia]|uniref:Uncharacterized protein n=1 Tax=Paramecium pentaurelia TaxID=43138 RepID=A0A8S1XT38_9CILI|nr:unnamed protein product [Paramecium pentaurelia]